MAPKKKYTPIQILQALEAVRKSEKIATDAKKSGLPCVTLQDKITGKTLVECSMGPKTFLSAEEEAILEKIVFEMTKNDNPITKDELLELVQRIIIDQQKTKPSKATKPGRKWYNLFLNKRSTPSAQNLTTARDPATEKEIKLWFKDVESYLKDKNLTEAPDDPQRSYNNDESAFFLSPQAGKVLAKTTDKHYQSSGDDEEDNLTVLITGNAAGESASPLVVFAYEKIPSTIYSPLPQDWAIGRSPSGRSPSGWMCGSAFY